jgi:hypothetical protein
MQDFFTNASPFGKDCAMKSLLQFGHGAVSHGFSKLKLASAGLIHLLWRSGGLRSRCFCVRNRDRGQASIVVQFGFTWLGRG